jgi:hypothetical protein
MFELQLFEIDRIKLFGFLFSEIGSMKMVELVIIRNRLNEILKLVIVRNY